MPYNRRYKRRTYKRRRGNIFWRRGANKAMRLAKYAVRMLNVEFKQHNINATPTASTSLGAQPCTNIEQGDTDTSRDGSSVKIMSFYLNGFATINSSATATLIRIMLVLDKQTNQAQFSAADLLTDVDVISPLNIDNGHRFRILAQRYITLSQDKPIVKFKIFKKFKKGVHIRFDNAAAAITSLTQNSLSLARISNEATNVPSLDYSIRLRYVDN